MCRVGAGFFIRGRNFACCLVLALALVGNGARFASAAAEPGFTPVKADKILVLKGQRQLELLRDGVVVKTYPIALGPKPRGPKHQSGDGKTPEGLYTIDGRHEGSPYHLALHISYPSTTQQAHAAAAHIDPGGDIFIHGLPASFGHADPIRFYKDWTQGCIAVGNLAIEEIWNAVRDGTPIEIRP